jgi:hypothetical protein
MILMKLIDGDSPGMSADPHFESECVKMRKGERDIRVMWDYGMLCRIIRIGAFWQWDPCDGDVFVRVIDN